MTGRCYPGDCDLVRVIVANEEWAVTLVSHTSGTPSHENSMRVHALGIAFYSVSCSAWGGGWWVPLCENVSCINGHDSETAAKSRNLDLDALRQKVIDIK